MPGINKYPTIRLRSGICEKLPRVSGETASLYLERFFRLLESALPEFAEAEWNLICDACNGWATTAESPEILVQALAGQVEDAVRLLQIDVKWGVDASSIVSRLYGLSPVAAMAVIVQVERFWDTS